MNNLSLRTLRYFAATAEERSISAAAERLHISPASISTAIRALEANLNVQLFVRLPARGMLLTPVGEIFASEVRSLLSHANELQNFAGALGNEVRGELSVACFSNLAPVHFSNLLAKFCRRHPEVAVKIHIGDQEDILSGLRRGSFELAFTFNLALSDQFCWEKLATLPPLIVMATSHRLAGAARVSLRDIAAEPLILMDLPHTREYFLSLFYMLELEPNIRFRSTSFETVRTLVGNELGYSLLNLIPRSSSNYDGTQIRYAATEERLLPLEIGCLSLRRLTQRRVATAFLEFTRDYFESTPRGDDFVRNNSDIRCQGVDS